MKLIFVNRYFHPDHSATSQLLGDLAFDQSGRGASVHVIASRQLYDDPATSLPSTESVQGVQVHRVWTSRFGRHRLVGRAVDYLTFYVSAAAKLAAIARPGDVIVAKTDPPLISVVAACVGRARGARLVNWVQDLFPEVAERLGVPVPGFRLVQALRNRSLRVAEANVAVGERMAAELARHCGKQARVEVITNWADGGNLRPIARDANPLRTRWGLGERFVVGYSGNMGRAHEFETLISACERVKGEGIAFLFIGSGRQREAIEQAVMRLSLSDVSFHPYQPLDKLAFSLSAADVHVVTLQPSLEGLVVPSKFYGIAAAGRPVIFVGDPDGEIARTVLEEGCGWTVRAGEPSALADLFRRLKADPAQVQEAGRRARAAFDRRFSRTVALERWHAVLNSAASARTPLKP